MPSVSKGQGWGIRHFSPPVGSVHSETVDPTLSPPFSRPGCPHWLPCQAGASGLTTVGKFEGQHAALMQVQLVLVRLGVVQNLHIAALHAHGQPLPRGAVAQGEDLMGQTI